MTRVFDGGDHPIRALDDANLQVAHGECVALLGVNGAGKTTLAKVLSTLLLPTSGSARISGFDVVREAREVRSRLAVVFGGERGLYSMLTQRENGELDVPFNLRVSNSRWAQRWRTVGATLRNFERPLRSSAQRPIRAYLAPRFSVGFRLRFSGSSRSPLVARNGRSSTALVGSPSGSRTGPESFTTAYLTGWKADAVTQTTRPTQSV